MSKKLLLLLVSKETFLKTFVNIISPKLFVLLVISLVMVLGFISVVPFSQGISSTNVIGPCKCVVFRMDDIQDYWIESGQIAPMNLFILKNQSLSLGLIMHDIGNDPKIVNKVSEGVHKGLFELAIHGWDHIDYTKLSEQDQKKSLYNANEKMRTIFGDKSNIFIPPEDAFSSITVKAMNDLGIGILSSSIWDEDNFDQKKSVFNASKVFKTQTDDTVSTQIYHLPGTIFFKDYVGGKWIKNSIKNIIDSAANNIDKYGYAVIVIHPQDFVRVKNRTSVDKLDENEIKDLSDIVDSLLSKDITISSFSKITGIKSNPYISQYYN
jgi:peptidoglycan/xylan/chitin deacetylase (PgdA/CDA1 family)